MKQVFLAIAILFSLQTFGALKVTGQLTNSDTVKIGDGTSYVRLTIIYNANGNSVDVLVDVYKGKASYNNGKSTLPDVIQIHRSYSIDSATLATSPTSSFASQPGKSLMDKELYWIHFKIGEKIVADNPTFTVQIVDIKL